MSCALVSGSAGTRYALVVVVATVIQYTFGADFNLRRWKRQSCRNNFRCKSGTCVDNLLICDGTEDCEDGSDETVETCRNITCPGFTFRCDYGACIDRNRVCNGVKQCADGSDESEKQCGPKTTTTTTTAQPPSSGCTLPPQPENGQYKLGGCNPPACQPVPGNKVQFAFINYICNPGFVLSGNQLLLCESGWSSSFPTCSKVSCAPLVNPSREIECKLNNKKVECDKPMAPGTKASVQCKIFFTNVREFSDFDTVCQPTGRWSRDVTSCIPKCGEPNPHGLPLIAGGSASKHGEFPWHVGIYRWIDEKYQQVCGGSIISERIIVTAAHCFWNVGAGESFDVKNFKVAVGKFYRDWNSKTERYIQTPGIGKLVLHDRFRGDQRQWQYDIALIVLKLQIQINLAVRPICVDFNKEYERFFTPGKKGIVVGWGVTENMTQSEALYTATLPYVGFEDCEKGVPQSFKPFLTNDKFCAGYNNGTSVCFGDNGSGYATQMRDGKWYLMGIVSVGVPSEKAACNIYQYTTFTKVSDYYDFLRNNIDGAPATNANSGFSCPSLVDPSKKIECKLNGRKVECDIPMVPGTTASVLCDGFYTHKKENFDYHTICQSNGKWTEELTSCIPKCGIPNPKGLPLVAGGTEAKYGEFPWHAGVYRWMNEEFQQVCSGSIISERAIVTAAHCFWNESLGSANYFQHFKVAVGKLYRHWNHVAVNGSEERFIQKPEIDDIILHDQFIGNQRVQQDDIAIIILKFRMEWTPAVLPICVDFDHKYSKFFIPGMKGIVVGWGVTEKMEQSETLRTAIFPYVGHQDCVEGVPESFYLFLTNDKFCAGYRNGTSVCPGDSGGSFSTQMSDGKWYLMGIVSVGVPAEESSGDWCNIYNYATFTKVSNYYDFMKDNSN